MLLQAFGDKVKLADVKAALKQRGSLEAITYDNFEDMLCQQHHIAKEQDAHIASASLPQKKLIGVNMEVRLAAVQKL